MAGGPGQLICLGVSQFFVLGWRGMKKMLSTLGFFSGTALSSGLCVLLGGHGNDV